MIDALRSESNILSQIPEHENIIKFYGAVLDNHTPDSQLHFRLMMELAERECVCACVFVCVWGGGGVGVGVGVGERKVGREGREGGERAKSCNYWTCGCEGVRM